MKNNNVRKLLGIKLLTGILAAVMVCTHPTAGVLAADAYNDVTDQAGSPDTPKEDAWDKEASAPLKARDAQGKLTEISEAVQKMLDENTVYLDEDTKYLKDESGRKIDPMSGDFMKDDSGNGQSERDSGSASAKTNAERGKSGTEGSVGAGNTDGQGPGNTKSSGDIENTAGSKGQGEKESQAAKDTAVKDTDANDNGEKDKAAKDKEENDKSIKDEDANDKDAKDKAAKDKDANDKAVKDITENDKAVKDKEKNATAAPAQPEAAIRVEAAIDKEKLIANPQLLTLPEIVKDFRFWTVEKRYAFAKADIFIVEKMEDNAKKVGSLQENGLCYVLKEGTDENSGWYYVESGQVRGYVKKEQVVTDKKAKAQLERYQIRVQKKAKREKNVNAERNADTERNANTERNVDTEIETIAPMAKALTAWRDNQAYTYLRATVRQTVVSKDYALATATPVKADNPQAGNLPDTADNQKPLSADTVDDGANALVPVDMVAIRENKNPLSRITGTLSEGSLCYILADKSQNWCFVESGNVRGFVEKKYLRTGDSVKKQVEQYKEESFDLAEELIKPEENRALYYTLTSVKPGVPEGEMRNSLLEYAARFIGNPYVWGGTSLINGADCSGFVQTLYGKYGYRLPRTAEEQAQCGAKEAVEAARPGDLIFYYDGSTIHHVVIYAGNGRTIEAMDSVHGIVQSTVNTGEAVWAVSLFSENPGEAAKIS